MWHETHRDPSDREGWNVWDAGSIALLAWHEVHCASSKGPERGRRSMSQ